MFWGIHQRRPIFIRNLGIKLSVCHTNAAPRLLKGELLSTKGRYWVNILLLTGTYPEVQPQKLKIMVDTFKVLPDL